MNVTSPRTPRTELSRHPERGSHDRAVIHAILDEALVCHVGFLHEGQPFVLPLAFGREGEVVFLHGSARSRMFGALAGGAKMCVTATLLDGLVMARSAFHHSMNYRSVVILGQGEEVTEAAEKRRALDAIVEHVARGRVKEVRAPTEGELAATRVIRLSIAEASAKIRTGPPIDLESDYQTPCWAGVVPVRLCAGTPLGDARLLPGLEIPPSVHSHRLFG